MPLKYLPYFKDPIKGQALLDNFVRTIRYGGSDKLGYKLKLGMPLYEVKLIETVRENTHTKQSEVSNNKKMQNLLLRGECLSACAYLKKQNIEVDLVYIDPPFASGADYAKKVYLRKNPKIAEAFKKAENEIEMNEDFKAFEEKMYGDIWNKEDYLNWMYENLTAIKSIMSENASIYVHLDWHIGHYVKILMDEIFGEENFVNEIVWRYSTSGKYDSSFARNADRIFLYSKNEEYIFNQARILDRVDLADKFTKGQKILEENGEKYYLYNGEKRTFYKQMQEIWIDIDKIKRDGDEILNYSTQKPEALLERILKASSDEGMIVADFFGGSGVTAAVAKKLNRHFIHCDVGINSIQTTRDRLKELQAEFDILEIKDGISLFRNPTQTMEKLKTLILGFNENEHLDEAYFLGSITDSKLGVVPVSVPNLLESSSKFLDEVMMNELINKGISALIDDERSIKKVIVYYVDMSEDMQEFIKKHNKTGIDIELKPLSEVLDEVVDNDDIEYELRCKNEDYEFIVTKFISDRVLSKIKAYNEKKQAQAIKNSKSFAPISISENGLECIEYLSLDCENADENATWISSSEIKITKDSFIIKNGVKTKEFWNGKIESKQKPLRAKVRNICGDESIIQLKFSSHS